MQSFENLIQASAHGLSAIFSPLRARLKGEGEARRTQLAQLLGLNVAQLVCGVGFNVELPRIPDLPRFIGFATRDAMLAERNYLFIHDRYRALSVNNIVEIYAALGKSPGTAGEWSDLVMSRLNNIEGQLEETINPVLIGGYKLEVRAIYENRLASPALVNARLDPNYAVLRDITNESMIMLEISAIPADAFLRHPGVTIDEKARGLFQNLIPRDAVASYIAEHPDADPERKLAAALGAA
ncbi:MAG: hypothetical protein IT493_04200 [Gammaproteobacteria bacterium]|nr:hypothetical protein [Gammaproteobacteria bacterium]